MKNYVVVFFLFWIGTTHFVIAENKTAEQSFQRGLELTKQRQADSAIYYFKQSLPLYEEAQQWESVVKTYYHLGENFNKKRAFKTSLEYFDKGILIAHKYLKENHPLLSRIHTYIGVVHAKLGQISLAKDAFLKSAAILEKNKIQDKSFAYLCHRLGMIFMQTADYPQSDKWLEKSLSSYQILPNLEKVSDVWIDLGTLSCFRRDTLKALNLYENAIKSKHTSKKSLGAVLSQLSAIYTAKKQYPKAIELSKQVIGIYEQLISLGYADRLISSIVTLGSLYQSQNNFPLALQHYQKALNLAEQENIYGKKHRETAKIYKSIGDVYLKKQNLQEALQNYQKTLIALLPDFNNSNIQVYPAANELFAEPWIMVALNAKANAFYQQYQKNHQVDDLKKAFEGYLLAIENLNIITQGFDSRESQAAIRNKEYDLFETAIQIAYELHQLYPSNKTYLQQAFTLAEKSKAFSLIQKLKNIENQQLAALPDSLVKQSRNLQQNIASIETQLKIDSTSTNFKDSLFLLQRKQTQLTNYLENTFPNYRKIKLQDKTHSLEALQKSLITQSSPQNNKALLEFFIGDSTLYTFLITPNFVQLKPIPFTPQVQKQIFNLQKSIYQKDSLSADQQFDQYTHNAQSLYHELFLKPFGYKTFQNIEHLFIIPDGLLYRIPFEALLTQAPTTSQSKDMNYQNLTYLLHTHTISYAYSATLLLKSLKKRPQNRYSYKGNLLGFAPSFEKSYQLLSNKMPKEEAMRDCKGSDLFPLPSSELEIDVISQIIGGQIFLKTDANKKTFLDEARHYQILHLSTHACMDEEDFESSRIYFADQPLLSKELYPLQLQADLAVLSACETGTGFIQKGEGVMSLARAFMYAGCPSVVSSLWSVNDEKTSELMENFYLNLQTGQAKSSALQNAKRSFLQNQNNEEAHPFYWAAFVQIGNPNPVDLSNIEEKYRWMFILVFGFIILIIFVIRYLSMY